MSKQTKNYSKGRKRQQPRKDSKSKRVNLDNERVDRLEKDIAGWKDPRETDKSNDVRWYANNPELLRSAASLPFSQTTGTTIGWAANDGASPSVPGVMSVYWIPTIGGYTDEAVNAAKESIYSFVVHANSRNTSYTSSDLMMVILAGTQIFSAIGSAIRAYGTMRLFDQRNKYLPKALINAMGFNYEDLAANLSNMWFDINEMIARSSQIWIPNTLPVMDRWFWLNSNIYMDSDSVKGQYYLFTQRCFWGFSEVGQQTGTSLGWMTDAGTVDQGGGAQDPAYRNANTNGLANTNTWANFRTMINGMFNALLDSEDRGIMMGDMLKAYGADKIYALSPITSEYMITPVYDREVLSQIENSTSVRVKYPAIVQDQSTGKIGYIPYTNVAGPISVLDCPPTQSILNFHQKENPTPEQIMVATRLKVAGTTFLDNGTGKVASSAPATSGTEWVNSYGYFMYNGLNQLQNVAYQQYDPEPNSGTLSSNNAYAELSFDWSPWTYKVVYDEVAVGDAVTTAKQPAVYIGYGDYDYYTVIDTETLRKMHTTAVYSEFGVPTI